MLDHSGPSGRHGLTFDIYIFNLQRDKEMKRVISILALGVLIFASCSGGGKSKKQAVDTKAVVDSAAIAAK